MEDIIGIAIIIIAVFSMICNIGTFFMLCEIRDTLNKINGQNEQEYTELKEFATDWRTKNDMLPWHKRHNR